LASEQELKQLDKEAKAEVDATVEEGKASPEPETKDLWADVYYKGTEPPVMRGREKDEVSFPCFETFICRDADLHLVRSTFTKRLACPSYFIPAHFFIDPFISSPSISHSCV
jgi:hypothetical protein